MKNEKKVFIEAQRLFRKQKHGMDIVVLELLQRLECADKKYAVTVLVKKDVDQCMSTSRSLRVQTLRSAFYPLWEQWILPRRVRKQSHALLHCTGNTAPLWGKNPLLVTIHDLIYLEENYLLKKDGGSLYQRFGNFYRSLVVPRVARRAKYIITVSEFQRQLIMQKLGIPENKISVVYNGADERFFENLGQFRVREILMKYGIDHSPYIFFLANTEPRKNTDGVLKAFKLFCEQYPEHPHKLVIKGLSDEILAKKIEACGAAAFADRIQRVGYIEYDDLPALYQGSSMLWFPSFTEGFGLPIVEAMAGGTPVITSNLSVMPEIGADAALYVDPHSPQELASQAASLLSDASLRNSIIEKGRARASKFKWSNSVQELQKIYTKLLR